MEMAAKQWALYYGKYYWNTNKLRKENSLGLLAQN